MSLVVLIRFRSIFIAVSGLEEYGCKGCIPDSASWDAYSCTADRMVRMLAPEPPASEDSAVDILV